MTSYHNKWRKFLSEQASPITKLRIFDFDETIAYTTSEVRAVDPEGRKFRFPNQHVWDNFLKQFRGKTTNELEQEGWRFDFSDFSEVRNPKENKRITQIVSYLIQANKNDRHRQLYVLTARGSDSQGPIRDYLKTINLHPDEFEGVIGLAGGSKKDAIKKMIEDHGGSVRSVHFFDDSHKNIDDVKQLEKDFPNIEFRIVHVSPEGIQKVNEEKFADYHAPKNKWIKLDPKKLGDEAKKEEDETTIADEVFALISNAYKGIGGHINLPNKQSIPADYDDWQAIDTDDDPDPDALKFSKGNKMAGGGHDGSEKAVKAYLDKTAEMLGTDGFYGELSKAMAHIMITRYHAPFVDNKEDVEKTLNKKVRWLGKHPEGKYPGYDGWYSRDIGGHREMKILLGNPPGVESKTPTIKEDVQPASFYPSRFDNLLKLLDENKDKIWVFFDTETTGLEYENEEVQITEIACASYDPKGFIEEPEEVGTFDIKISLQPETKAAMKKQTRGQTGRNPTIRDLLKMTGYGSKGVPYVQPAEALDRFEAFLDEMRSKSPSGEIMMVAQNAAFDVGIINQLYFRIDREPPGDVSFDTKAVIENHLMPVVRELMKVPEEERTAQDNQIIRSLVQGKQISGSLGKMLSAFDIKNKGWHSAIADVQMTMEMMYNIVKYLRTKSSRLRNKTSFRQFEPLGGDPVYGFRGPKKGQIPNRTK
jgi:DNA polymerase III epsilon subunit-like protein